MDMKVILVDDTMRRPKPECDSELGFGRFFSDHMFLVDYNSEADWHNPRIVPYGPLSIEPSAAVFHYAQEVFEGFKAYRGGVTPVWWTV